MPAELLWFEADQRPRPARGRAANRGRGRRGPIPYDQFRTGLTFRDVRRELDEEARRAYEAGRYMWVTRRTVLGRLRQHKLEAYEQYLRERRRRRRERLRARRARERALAEGLPF